MIYIFLFRVHEIKQIKYHGPKPATTTKKPYIVTSMLFARNLPVLLIRQYDYSYYIDSSICVMKYAVMYDYFVSQLIC